MRQVRAQASLGVNYIYHLLAVARIGFDSEYATEMRDSVSSTDLELISQHRPYLTFAKGAGGELTDIFISLPLIIGLDAEAAFEEYFSLVDVALADASFEPLKRRYDLRPERFLPFYMMESQDLIKLVKYRTAIAALGQVACRSLPIYMANVWPTQREEIQAVADRIESHFKGNDIVASWEHATGLHYTRETFDIELCSAIKKGPNANTLSYGRVVFYHETPFEWLVDFISHEIGTHLLHHLYRELVSSGRYDQQTLFHAYESLAAYYNHRALHKETLAYTLPDSFRASEYIAFYRSQIGSSSSIALRQLLRAAVESFSD